MNDTKQGTLIIAGSIVFAGLLVAAGIFFGSGEVGSEAIQKEAATSSQKADTAQAKEIDIPAVQDGRDYIRGSADASAVVVEYSDPECPYCKQFHQTMKQVIESYDNSQVGWAYRHWPVQQLHPQAPEVAQAIECAGQLGEGDEQFWTFTDTLYEEIPRDGQLDTSKLPEFADQAGIDVDEFNNCRESDEYQDIVKKQARNAKEAGGRGTPYSVIVTERGNTYPLPGALPTSLMNQVLDTVLSGIEKDMSADQIQGQISSALQQ